jgi:outer membrane biosynthesis protein TonB
MKLLTGKRIGQSGGELTTAILFSFIIHIIFFFAALFLIVQGPPRFVVPPSYRVKLVDLPPDAANLLPTMSEQAAQPPAPAHVAQPQVKQQAKAAARSKAAPKPTPPVAVSKDAMPELDQTKQPKKTVEEPVTDQPPVAAGKKQETVTMQAPSEFSAGSAFEWYSYNVRRKITSNWKHPVVPKGTKTKVVFTVLRSGIAVQVKLEDASGIFAYDQASLRAIQMSSPFPALPEDFLKPSVVFSVDLLPEE